MIYDKSLPDSFIFDMDGTLAHGTGRGMFDWGEVGSDSLDENVAHILDALFNAGRQIIIVTGRDSICELETRTWLNDNDITYHQLFMRPKGDKRPDTEVKREIYENNIKGKFNVLGVFEDRDSVVKLWRELGFKCYQCEYGAF